MFTSYVNNKDS
jgi:hypothetical protein